MVPEEVSEFFAERSSRLLLELLLAVDLPPSHDGMIDCPAQPGSEALNTASMAISKSRRLARANLRVAGPPPASSLG